MKKNLLQDSILWHDGMMLTAQHFEQLNGRIEKLIWYHSQNIMPYYWGITELEIDETQLANAKLMVTKLNAILPDGLIINLSQKNFNGLELDLATATYSRTEKAVTISLFVPPIDLSESSELINSIRYKQLKPDTADTLNDSDIEEEIPYRTPNISLQIIDKGTNDKSSIPLFKIINNNGQFQLMDFVPPTMMILPYSPLWRIISSILQKIKTKSSFLASQISPYSVLYEPAILDKRFLLQNLMAGLPPLEALMQSGRAHPYQVYLLLCSLLGHLSTMGYDLSIESPAVYNHNDLFSTFTQFKNHIFRVLDESIGEKYHTIPFEKKGLGFQIGINKQWLEQPLVIGLTVKKDLPAGDVIYWFGNCLIGSESDIYKMRRQRTLGVQRRKIDKNSNYPSTLDSLFFEIETESINHFEPLVIFNPSDIDLGENIQGINLYIKRKFEM